MQSICTHRVCQYDQYNDINNDIDNINRQDHHSDIDSNKVVSISEFIE